MTTQPQSTNPVTLSLAAEELAELLRLVESSLGETRVEMHRTHTPEFRDKVHHEEDVLRGLLQKLRAAKG